MNVLITGSVAYDTLLYCDGHFKDGFLTHDLDHLSAAFLTPRMEKRFGGCAGNIAFYAAKLGLAVRPVASVGGDFGPYQQWMLRFGIATDDVQVFDDLYTAQAFVGTDASNAQLTFFHPGAMAQAAKALPDMSLEKVCLGCVSPNDKAAMLGFSNLFCEANIPFVFDPGQAIPMFSDEELISCIKKSSCLVVNAYEFSLLMKKTGLKADEFLEHVPVCVVTNGEEGAQLHTISGVMHFDPVILGPAKDPTGCGDAFRSGLLYGMYHQWNWQDTLRLANFMGGVKVMHQGAQSEQVDDTIISDFLRENIAEPIKT